MCIRDSVHTATAWRILENYTRIPVEHIMIERIKQNKSLVDIKLTARACQEHYQKLSLIHIYNLFLPDPISAPTQAARGMLF